MKVVLVNDIWGLVSLASIIEGHANPGSWFHIHKASPPWPSPLRGSERSPEINLLPRPSSCKKLGERKAW